MIGVNSSKETAINTSKREKSEDLEDNAAGDDFLDAEGDSSVITETMGELDDSTEEVV
eukprot:CAMPEP_0119053722 /NCGR_PEP_ID=MMETSP1177-20130426/74611_1 /TAXON_ID=2985 /ORGANISM="Ochromonas sp, Strain CCMP1899" /LENGTH=57 /DNA_ID=CAMNT_0007033755 /DNA_START=252 /DNA_END=425 /DNA_ORIENTATION=+